MRRPPEPQFGWSETEAGSDCHARSARKDPAPTYPPSFPGCICLPARLKSHLRLARMDREPVVQNLAGLGEKTVRMEHHREQVAAVAGGGDHHTSARVVGLPRLEAVGAGVDPKHLVQVDGVELLVGRGCG